MQLKTIVLCLSTLSGFAIAIAAPAAEANPVAAADAMPAAEPAAAPAADMFNNILVRRISLLLGIYNFEKFTSPPSLSLRNIS